MAGKGGKTRGAGRPKGVPNKINSDVKKMILAALDKAGGEEYLLLQARTNANSFMTLLGKVLPTTLSNDSENPVQFVTQVNLAALKPSDNSND